MNPSMTCSCILELSNLSKVRASQFAWDAFMFYLAFTGNKYLMGGDDFDVFIFPQAQDEKMIIF